MSTEREKMAAGEWYSCMDAELDMLRWHSRRAVHQHNTMPSDERGTIGPLLRALFASVGEGAFIEAPFHCAYGFNITLGRNAYLNAGCTILDSAKVAIGDGAMLGPPYRFIARNTILIRFRARRGLRLQSLSRSAVMSGSAAERSFWPVSPSVTEQLSVPARW